MRVTKEQNAEHRRVILNSASKLFRERGFEVSIADLMKETGLTHGAFYSNFDSKSTVAAETCRLAFEQTLRGLRSAKSMSDFIDFYLSEKHRDDPGRGCPMACFTSSIQSQERSIRLEFARGLATYIDEITARIGRGSSSHSRTRRKALGIITSLTGALALSRSISDVDPHASASLLKEARAEIRANFSL